jgi:hypothetical protein
MFETSGDEEMCNYDCGSEVDDSDNRVSSVITQAVRK